MLGDKFLEDVPCDLSEGDRATLGLELAEAIVERDRIAEELAAYTKRHRATIKELDESISEKATALESGSILRAIECFERANYSTDQVEVVRTDTQEVVWVRPFESDERAVPLFGRDVPADDDEPDEREDMPAPLEPVADDTQL